MVEWPVSLSFSSTTYLRTVAILHHLTHIYLRIPFLALVFSRKFAGNSLPPVMGFSNERLPHTEGIEISLDTDAVVQTIREEAARIAKAASTA